MEKGLNPAKVDFGFGITGPGKERAIYVLKSETSHPLSRYRLRGALDLGRLAIDPLFLTVKNVNYRIYVRVGGGRNAINIVRLSSPMEKRALITAPTYPRKKGAGDIKNYPVNEGLHSSVSQRSYC